MGEVNLDSLVLVPPAAGMMAGAIGAAPICELKAQADLAIKNLIDTKVALTNEGTYDATYGFPNYLDFGSGQVNENDPRMGLP